MEAKIGAAKNSRGLYVPYIETSVKTEMLNHLVKKSERGAIGAARRAAKAQGYTIEGEG